jgi:hypothetical protein
MNNDKIKEHSISSFNDFHNLIQKYDFNFTIFRGVKKKEYELIPRVGRIDDWSDEYKNRPLVYIEKDLLRIFCERAIPFIERVLEDDWQWLAVAQHFRLPTRLLDWSRNPLIAAYFAVDKKYDGDSAVYVLQYPGYIDFKKDIGSPFEYNYVNKYIPSHFINRIIGQSSLFTIHPNPKKPYYGDRSHKLEKIIIENKNDFRRDFKKILYKYGIHKASLFQDLEALSNHVEWMKRNVHDINEE